MQATQAELLFATVGITLSVFSLYSCFCFRRAQRTVCLHHAERRGIGALLRQSGQPQGKRGRCAALLLSYLERAGSGLQNCIHLRGFTEDACNRVPTPQNILRVLCYGESGFQVPNPCWRRKSNNVFMTYSGTSLLDDDATSKMSRQGLVVVG
jgi:hypothetical protein